MKKLSIARFSVQGGREVNEDAMASAHRGRRYVGVVADGLGGQGGGNVASRIVADTLFQQMLDEPRPSPAAVRSVMERANSSVLAEQISAGCKMMSTVAVVVVDGRQLLMAHLGDTRIYRFRGNRLLYCSHDHSVTQSLADSGEITREQMRTHETRNLLLKCLGMMETPNPVIRRGFVWGDEKLLVCSDGFWEKFSDAELCEAMSGRGAEAILSGLKKTALARAGEDSDNITALLIG